MSLALPNGGAEGEAAGLRDMRNLSLAIGLPAPRILFDAMVEASRGTNGEKEAWRRELGQMSEVTETGCIRIDFSGEAAPAYLVLDACGPDHDLTAQLDKIYSRIPAGRRKEILKHLSVLVHLGRAAYALMATKVRPVLAQIGEKTGGPASPPHALHVDFANTTLYVPHIGGRRVGIFVRLGEIGDGPADKMMGAGRLLARADGSAADPSPEEGAGAPAPTSSKKISGSELAARPVIWDVFRRCTASFPTGPPRPAGLRSGPRAVFDEVIFGASSASGSTSTRPVPSTPPARGCP